MTATASPTMLPIGPRHGMEPMADVRSPGQRDAVRRIIETPEFDYVFGGNPFIVHPEIGDYQGPFNFLYVTTNGVLHLARLCKAGGMLHSVCSSM